MSHFTSQLVADVCTGSQVGEGGVLEPQRQAAGACFAAVVKATRNIIPPPQLLQVLQADGGGEGVGESLKSKIEAAVQAWQQSKHEGTCDTRLQNVSPICYF